MQFLSIEQASKSYGDKVLFKNINLTISKGEKIALIAKNGSGKTTLLRTIAGHEGVEGENAKISLAKGIKIAFLDQEPKLEDHATVLESIFQTDTPAVQAVKAYEMALASQDEEALRKASIAMDDQNAWDIEAKAKEILSKLKIDRLDQAIATLSGGQKKRIALAQIILSDPDFLILDEPTNHLDIDMIEWLEDYLSQSSLTLFMVTHDRYFLEKVCNEIIELDRGEIFVYRGNYRQYLEKKEARLANEAANYDKNRKLFSKELEWMRRQPQARTTKAKSRIDDFYELKENLGNKVNQDEMSIQIQPARLGSKIVELHAVSKSYDGRPILKSFNYKFKKNERLGIVGHNGSGKSTFVKLITGLTEPDSGKIVIGETVVFGNYTQEGLYINKDKMVIDVIRDIAEYIPLEKGLKLTAESLLEKFLFPRSQQRVYVSQLSGGEKRRLFLLSILMKNPNFLILDEPTNDLDIVTLNVLEDYLADYPGCLIIISHDRYFMDKLVDHLFIVEGNGEIKDHNGNYSDYRAYLQEKKNLENSQQTSTVTSNEKTNSKNDFELRKEIKALEKQIEKLEEKKLKISSHFDDMGLSPDQIQKYATELKVIQQEIDEKEERWMELSESLT